LNVKWLLYLDNTISKRLHAFPVDESQYRDWALCGRGSGASKAEGEQPLCDKCKWILEDFSERELIANRLARAGEGDFYE